MTTPHCTAVVDLGLLADNVATLRERTGTALMAVVKADAYGHGLVPCAQAALSGGATWLATALLSEAIALRDAGVTAPTLAWLNTIDDRFPECIGRGIDLGINSTESLGRIVQAAQQVGKRARVHIKVDTGLSRNGVTMFDLDSLIMELLRERAHIDVVGVMSHFAYADEPTNPTIARQADQFAVAIDKLTAAGFDLEVKHLSNSAATLGLPETYFNLVRPGVAMYGISPGEGVGTPESLDLRPVMTLKSTVALVKHVPAGTGVSYAHQYHTTRDTHLALVPVGYADGLPRAASNKGQVLLRGEKLTVAGRICMDQFVLDVGDSNVRVGDEVVIFGDATRGEPTAEDWGRAADTIGYEIITRIGPRVVRRHINAPE
jgi:alanine racemase